MTKGGFKMNSPISKLTTSFKLICQSQISKLKQCRQIRICSSFSQFMLARQKVRQKKPPTSPNSYNKRHMNRMMASWILKALKRHLCKSLNLPHLDSLKLLYKSNIFRKNSSQMSRSSVLKTHMKGLAIDLSTRFLQIRNSYQQRTGSVNPQNKLGFLHSRR